VVTGLVFSVMQGIFHAYYAVALAPAVGAPVGMGVTGLWRARVLLRRTPAWQPGLAALVLVGGLAVAAAVGSNSAAGAQLATGEPVMAIGGFNGSDPAPTLEQFQRLVAEGRIHYFLGRGRTGGSMGGSDAARQISAWVQQRFTATSVGGATVYDLTTTPGASPTAAGSRRW
jgi:4-amino-4-deoxy-L-arabinose transferase-like glycosyltransferase